MPSNKPRIATYTTQGNIDKLKVIAAYNRMSMSEYLNYMIEKEIESFEEKNGKIKIPGTNRGYVQ